MGSSAVGQGETTEPPRQARVELLGVFSLGFVLLSAVLTRRGFLSEIAPHSFERQVPKCKPSSKAVNIKVKAVFKSDEAPSSETVVHQYF